VWTHQVVFISVNHSKSADGDLHEVQLHTLLTAELDTPSKVDMEIVFLLVSGEIIPWRLQLSVILKELPLYFNIRNVTELQF